MSWSGSGYWIWFLEGVEMLIQMERRSANFGAKLAPSLNGQIRILWTQLLDLFVDQSAQISYRIYHRDFMANMKSNFFQVQMYRGLFYCPNHSGETRVSKKEEKRLKNVALALKV
jgi:hypothetical protein